MTPDEIRQHAISGLMVEKARIEALLDLLGGNTSSTARKVRSAAARRRIAAGIRRYWRKRKAAEKAIARQSR